MLNMIYKLGRTLSGTDTNMDAAAAAAIALESSLDMVYFDNFHELPDELVLNIFQFLKRKNVICKLELVNHRFYRLARNEFLWWNMTFNKRGRSAQIRHPSVQLFEQNPERETFPKFTLNCRDYYMEKILVKRSCETLTNKMFSPSTSVTTPTTPGGGEASPTTLKRKLRMTWKPVLSTGSNDSQMLFAHDRPFEKRMKMAQENSAKLGHYNPHARHRHTITCTSPDESSFVMIGGFKNANNIAVPPTANPADNEVEDADVVHEFHTTRAHFQQRRIRTPGSVDSPLTPSPNQFAFSFPTTPTTPPQLHLPQHLNFNTTTTTTTTTTTATTNDNNNNNNNNIGGHPTHIRTNSMGGKPMQFGKHSCVCVDNSRLLLFGGTEGENTVVTNNLYVYDLHTNDWYQKEFPVSAVQPSPRTNHQAALVTSPDGRREMLIVGGGVGQLMTPTDDIWALDVDTYTWRKVEVKLREGQKTCPFTPRLGFTMHEMNNKLIIYGGGYWYQNGQDKKWKEYYRELFVFDVKTSTWTNIDMSHCIDQVPRSGTFPVSCRVGAHLFVVGGGIVWDVSSEVNVLDLVTFKWRKVNSEQSYAADSSACITLKDYSENPQVPKTKILLFGGYRYKPLSEYKVFSVKWKDFMTERGSSSVNRMEPIPSRISTTS